MKTLNPTALAEILDARFAADIAEANISGASAAVLQGGELLYKKFHGAAKEDTVFRLASMTKPITAAAVLILIDRGLLRLEDRVAEYLPGYASMKVDGGIPSGTPLTLLHLLTHTSGIGTGKLGEAQAREMTPEDNRTLAAAVDYYSRMELAFEPFTKSLYSGTAAFDVAARIVEIVSGKDFADFVREEITEPLGMTDTAFAPTKAQWARMIPMHNKVDGASVIAPMPEGCVFGATPTSHPLGGAGLASTLDDYIKFAIMLRNRGGTILSERAISMMATEYVPEAIKKGGESWGLGVRVIRGGGNLPAGAFGWSGAYGTHFWIDPENDIVAVYMKNSRFDGGSGARTSWQFEVDVMRALE